MTYRGEPIQLPDGTTVRPGDAVAELHLNNRKVVEAAQISPWRLQTVLRQDLHAVALWAQSSSGSGVVAVFGVTLLSVGGERLGFARRPLPRSLYVRLNRFFMSGLLALYSPRGLDRLRLGTTPDAYPEEIWLSRKTLIERYGSERKKS